MAENKKNKAKEIKLAKSDLLQIKIKTLEIYRNDLARKVLLHHGLAKEYKKSIKEANEQMAAFYPSLEPNISWMMKMCMSMVEIVPMAFITQKEKDLSKAVTKETLEIDTLKNKEKTQISFLLGTHPHVGQDSPLQIMGANKPLADPNTIKYIFEYLGTPVISGYETPVSTQTEVEKLGTLSF